MISSPFLTNALTSLCYYTLWWGHLLGNKSWIVLWDLPYFPLHFNSSFPSLAFICCSKCCIHICHWTHSLVHNPKLLLGRTSGCSYTNELLNERKQSILFVLKLSYATCVSSGTLSPTTPITFSGLSVHPCCRLAVSSLLCWLVRWTCSKPSI